MWLPLRKEAPRSLRPRRAAQVTPVRDRGHLRGRDGNRFKDDASEGLVTLQADSLLGPTQIKSSGETTPGDIFIEDRFGIRLIRGPLIEPPLPRLAPRGPGGGSSFQSRRSSRSRGSPPGAVRPLFQALGPQELPLPPGNRTSAHRRLDCHSEHGRGRGGRWPGETAGRYAQEGAGGQQDPHMSSSRPPSFPLGFPGRPGLRILEEQRIRFSLPRVHIPNATQPAGGCPRTFGMIDEGTETDCLPDAR